MGALKERRIEREDAAAVRRPRVETSSEALDEIAKIAKPTNGNKRHRLQRLVLGELRISGEAGRTAEEVALATGQDKQSITPRFAELRDLGLIRETDRKRRANSGRRTKVWVLTEYVP